MKTYREHKIVTSTVETYVQDTMNELAEDGWQVSCFQVTAVAPPYNAARFTALMNRIIEEDES